LTENQPGNKKASDKAICLGCGKEISDPVEQNKLGDEFICNNCAEEMISSLDDAWRRHSAFLDAALN